ncbi:hypothetical protein Cgig2_015460 [Carnegiea gigantea]|uniref:glucose-1-phosphate adenylyltransferase n=1 Tax=Carnegiea gigantea TaxID=171969 RepID=A0A9Q1Q8N4_9CARY|nr:hypothetical protein Cgig2_015460 [Carnegiea gigantea]
MARGIHVAAPGRGCRVVKFGSKELMGMKLKSLHRQSKSVKLRGHVCMSVVTGIAAEVQPGASSQGKKDIKTVAAVILGGGAGTRLFPLTKRCAKPAGTADAVRQFCWLLEDQRSKDVEDVLILSGDHLYRMDYMDFVQLSNSSVLRPVPYSLISRDVAMTKFCFGYKDHWQSGADITISCIPMDDNRASDFGLMKIDETGRVLFFSEKPKGDDLKAMAALIPQSYTDLTA